MTRLDAPLTYALDGEIDLGCARGVLAEIEALLADRPSRLRLDLSAVSFLDSAGLRVLDAAVAAGELLGVPVDLVAPSRAVTRLVGLVTWERGYALAC